MSEAPVVENKNSLIVFVHGILGFSTIKLPGFTIRYFRNVERHLSSVHIPILFAKLPSVGTIAERAKHLADFLAPYKKQNIYLIAHSMGGLDSRYFIHHYDSEKQVRALATVGTPHRGTALAARFLHDMSLVARTGRLLSCPGLFDLTPEACLRFNDLVPNRPDVRYISYGGCRPTSEIPLLSRSWACYVQQEEGDNDSQVSVNSTVWGESHQIVRADHLELVGWSCAPASRKAHRPFDHLTFYQEMADKLLSGE
jgi:triacylglycerol lipase